VKAWQIGGVLALLALAVGTGARMVWPVVGRISSGFRDADRPEHNGVDIAVPVGTEITAPADGVVVDVYTHERGGLSMRVDLVNGYSLGFAHLSETFYPKGAEFYGGAPLALSGNSGVSTGPHVHLTVRRDGELIDPETVFA
jgi:murein DD-endopeptidase MepM/ murein hydrolase activator NlpD